MTDAQGQPLAVIRPEPGNSTTSARARAMGLAVLAMPLFAVRPTPWTPPDPARFDALLIGSANVFRHGGEALPRFRALPVLAVGGATADAAKDAGFDVIATGSGGLQTLIPEARARGYKRLLRLGGRDRVDLESEGVTVDAHVLYVSEAVAMREGDAAALRSGAVIAIHSARAMTHLAEQCDVHGVRRDALSLVTIGPRVTAVSGLGWHRVITAKAPDDAALLAAARKLCEKP